MMMELKNTTYIHTYISIIHTYIHLDMLADNTYGIVRRELERLQHDTDAPEQGPKQKLHGIEVHTAQVGPVEERRTDDIYI